MLSKKDTCISVGNLFTQYWVKCLHNWLNWPKHTYSRVHVFVCIRGDPCKPPSYLPPFLDHICSKVLRPSKSKNLNYSWRNSAFSQSLAKQKNRDIAIVLTPQLRGTLMDVFAPESPAAKRLSKDKRLPPPHTLPFNNDASCQKLE